MRNVAVARKLQNAPECRRIIDPYAIELAKIPFNAWDEFKTEYDKQKRQLYDPTLKASIIHAHMIKIAKELDLKKPGINYLNPYNRQHMLSVEKRVLMRFKKMGQDLNTSNIPTNIQRELENGQLEAFEEGQFKYFVNVGYVPDDTWSGFERIVIMETYSDNEPRWMIEFDADLEVTNDIYGTIDMFDTELEEVSHEPEVEVKLKKDIK